VCIDLHKGGWGGNGEGEWTVGSPAVVKIVCVQRVRGWMYINQISLLWCQKRCWTRHQTIDFYYHVFITKDIPWYTVWDLGDVCVYKQKKPGRIWTVLSGALHHVVPIVHMKHFLNKIFVGLPWLFQFSCFNFTVLMCIILVIQSCIFVFCLGCSWKSQLTWKRWSSRSEGKIQDWYPGYSWPL